jgi:hypothetical protein
MAKTEVILTHNIVGLGGESTRSKSPPVTRAIFCFRRVLRFR